MLWWNWQLETNIEALVLQQVITYLGMLWIPTSFNLVSVKRMELDIEQKPNLPYYIIYLVLFPLWDFLKLCRYREVYHTIESRIPRKFSEITKEFRRNPRKIFEKSVKTAGNFRNCFCSVTFLGKYDKRWSVQDHNKFQKKKVIYLARHIEYFIMKMVSNESSPLSVFAHR